jgi:hypothetical protein
MKTSTSIAVGLGVLATVVTKSYPAATNELELAVRGFPEVAAEEYRPDKAIKAANALISAGKQTTHELITGLGHGTPQSLTHQDLVERESLNKRLCCLCRLLFTPKSFSAPLRPPKLGTPVNMPYASMGSGTWPDLPFTVISNTPISMNLGYAGSGIAERAKDYLAYCESQGVFRTQPFPQPTYTSVSNSLYQVFHSAAWKSLRWRDSGPGWQYNIDEGYAMEMLWSQLRNMSE